MKYETKAAPGRRAQGWNGEGWRGGGRKQFTRTQNAETIFVSSHGLNTDRIANLEEAETIHEG